MRTGVLGQRDVRLIGGAVGLSALGDFLLWVPLTLHLHAMTGSGVAVAALFVALWAPIVVLAPVAGLLVDRLEARALLLVASLAQAALAAHQAPDAGPPPAGAGGDNRGHRAIAVHLPGHRTQALRGHLSQAGRTQPRECVELFLGQLTLM